MSTKDQFFNSLLFNPLLNKIEWFQGLTYERASNASNSVMDEKAGKFEIDACTSHAPKVISYAKFWTSFL